jgi:16S rRNA (guanine966-N2)-methyltransferase
MDAQSSIRIIGGKWRSRKVIFMTKEALRPTPDRVRETLFNWLAPAISGAACLGFCSGFGE